MATKAISALSTSYATLQAGDTIAVDRSGVTGKTTRAQLAADILGDISKTGSDTDVVTGTAGSDGDVVTWNADGDAVGGTRLGDAFIISKDASNSATLDFTEFDNTKYDAYVFEIANIIPATDATGLAVVVSRNGGSSYDETAGHYSWVRIKSGVTVTDTPSSTLIALTGNVGSATGESGVSGTLRIHGPHLVKSTFLDFVGGCINDLGAFEKYDTSGVRLIEAAVDAIRFKFGTGNIESGTITMYGLRNS